jgi:hypothetical protein
MEDTTALMLLDDVEFLGDDVQRCAATLGAGVRPKLLRFGLEMARHRLSPGGPLLLLRRTLFGWFLRCSRPLFEHATRVVIESGRCSRWRRRRQSGRLSLLALRYGE